MLASVRHIQWFVSKTTTHSTNQSSKFSSLAMENTLRSLTGNRMSLWKGTCTLQYSMIKSACLPIMRLVSTGGDGGGGGCSVAFSALLALLRASHLYFHCLRSLSRTSRHGTSELLVKISEPFGLLVAFLPLPEGFLGGPWPPIFDCRVSVACGG